MLGLGSLATTTAQPIETTTYEPTDLASIIQRERCLNLTSVTPVVTDEETVGVVAIYDDPSTQRAEDYLELYDSDGDLVAVGWFDKFGIQRWLWTVLLSTGQPNFKGLLSGLIAISSVEEFCNKVTGGDCMRTATVDANKNANAFAALVHAHAKRWKRA